jgi:phospho-N-acetylmuramoyl-pentapeptide-transferase
MAESFSVIIQVAYYKKTGGKRIFRMSPIHHHYELGGWSEGKIVRTFAGVSIVGGVAALLLILPIIK